MCERDNIYWAIWWFIQQLRGRARWKCELISKWGRICRKEFVSSNRFSDSEWQGDVKLSETDWVWITKRYVNCDDRESSVCALKYEFKREKWRESQKTTSSCLEAVFTKDGRLIYGLCPQSTASISAVCVTEHTQALRENILIIPLQSNLQTLYWIWMWMCGVLC